MACLDMESFTLNTCLLFESLETVYGNRKLAMHFGSFGSTVCESIGVLIVLLTLLFWWESCTLFEGMCDDAGTWRPTPSCLSGYVTWVWHFARLAAVSLGSEECG